MMELLEKNFILKTVISEGRPETLRLTGNSMFPALVSGDLLTLDYEIENNNLKDGDVVVACSPHGKVYIHRYLIFLHHPL